MNYYDLVNRAYAATDRNPNTAAYKNKVGNFLNDYYLGLCSSQRWRFLATRTIMSLKADYTTGTVTTTNGSRIVTGALAGWTSIMDGAQFVDSGGAVYTIGHVGGVGTLYLTREYAGPGGALQSYTIRYFSYAMPQDCIEPANIVSRDDDQGRIWYIDNETEASAYLDRDNTGDPKLYASAGFAQTRTLDTEFTAAASAGGSLAASTQYSYRITVVYEGIEGPPSKEVTVTTTAVNKLISLTNIQNLQVAAASAGYVKRLYRRTGANGPYYYLADIADNIVSFFDFGLGAENFERPLIELGQTFRVWFWPRPDSAKEVELWYYKRPKRLDKDQDVPILPLEFHDVLWRAAAIDVMKAANQPTTTMEKHLEDQLANMRKRYLTASDRHYRMGNGWEGDFLNGNQIRLGTASIS